MSNFFGPTASDMQDDFEADTSERPAELLAEDDLGGMMEASKTMDYDSDTSNDDPIDYEEENERWEDERSDVDELSQQVDDRDGRNGPDDQPLRKRQKCDIPVLKDCKTAHENKQKILQSALMDIEKLIQSRKTEFEGGLQCCFRCRNPLAFFASNQPEITLDCLCTCRSIWVCKEMGWAASTAMGADLAKQLRSIQSWLPHKSQITSFSRIQQSEPFCAMYI